MGRMEVGEAMTNRNKAKGTAWETDVRKYLREHQLDVEPLRQLGTVDEGDLVVRTPNTDARIVLEAKNRGQVSLPQFLREAADESALYAHNRGIPQASTFGVAVVKARQKPTGQAYAVLTLEDFVRLMKRL